MRPRPDSRLLSWPTGSAMRGLSMSSFSSARLSTRNWPNFQPRLKSLLRRRAWSLRLAETLPQNSLSFERNMKTVISVNVGLPRDLQIDGRSVATGIFKTPVAGLVRVRTLNLDGDG